MSISALFLKNHLCLWTLGAFWDHFDIILGSDVVWLEHLIPSLVSLFQKLTIARKENDGVRTPVIILSHQTRSQRSDEVLWESLRVGGFKIERIPEGSLHPQFKSPKVNLFRIQRVHDSKE